MAGMDRPETPEDYERFQAEDLKVRECIDTARLNLALTLRAMDSDEPPEVVDLWTDILYDTLALAGPVFLARAVVTLLMSQAQEVSNRWAVSMGDNTIREVTRLWTEQEHGPNR